VDRREFLLGSTAGLAAATAQPAGPPGRNVLLLIADDQGLDVGCYGGRVKTPHLDQLAAKATLFTQGYATVSSCSSSRSVLYTGLFSHTNGMYGLAHDVHNQSLLDWVVTLPKLMRAAGYRTALVGKKHIRPEAALPYDAELVPEKPGIRDVAALAAAVGSFIRASASKPFFITVGFSDPHRASENFGNTRTWPGVARLSYDPTALELPEHLPDLPAVREDLAQYYESVSRLDSGLGLILSELQAAGHDTDTLIIFLSDNGRAFPGAKTTLYDAGIHLPLIIRAPQRTPGIRCDAMVSWIDIAPTILDFAGAAGPSTYRLHGRTLLPILDQPQPQGWDRVFASHCFHEIDQYYPMRAMRTRTHAYIANLAHELEYPIAGDVASSPSWKAIASARAKLGKRTLAAYLHRPAEELYDVVKDPEQLVNVAGSAAYREVLEQMRAAVKDWRAATRDPWLQGQTSPFEH
jgi:N-sulfoglucosamine sulfohydrolase